jgi:EAL domain-containing protein (putative c-di-GMP-specific phosphodiesterase class I)
VETNAQALREHGVAPDRLRLEVTEGAVVESVDGAGAALARIRELGVRVYLDDFGTGYSSLAYLARLPVDALKIDRAFVSGIGDDPAALRMVRTVINLAHDLGLSVVAEGVETPPQLAALRGLGCAYGQGYLLGRGMEAGAATERMRSEAECLTSGVLRLDAAG